LHNRANKTKLEFQNEKTLYALREMAAREIDHTPIYLHALLRSRMFVVCLHAICARSDAFKRNLSKCVL